MGEARIAADDTVDLGEIALALVFRSVGYALLGLIAAAVASMLTRISGYDGGTNAQFWLLSVAVWAVLQIEIFLRLRRIARASPPIRSSARTIHALELTAAGFLLLFSIARPYLLESDASSYPYLPPLAGMLPVLEATGDNWAEPLIGVPRIGDMIKRRITTSDNCGVVVQIS